MAGDMQLNCSDQHQVPLQLPSGKLSDLAWLFGVGLYPTAAKIPAISREITLGGHPHPQASTRTFFLPIPQDGKPSILWKCDVKMGYVKTNMSAPRTCHPHHLTLLRDLLPPRISHDDLPAALEDDKDKESHLPLMLACLLILHHLRLPNFLHHHHYNHKRAPSNSPPRFSTSWIAPPNSATFSPANTPLTGWIVPPPLVPDKYI
ncbi:hypothetical protein VP01_3208g2 [Puccinia sorghi]|uniref:Uncharacterized protein n=1 Tax=Puccinia sorghi TaxID=27349 RepID=A0A0L6UYB9_9BASI|nr:hypothetical protein VP01_3208g2 [Puccinia sorghi]